MGNVLTVISQLLIEGGYQEIAEKTKAALKEGFSAIEVLNDGLMPGMDHVGEEFKQGIIFVPEVLRSAKAMQESMNIIRPILVETGAEPSGVIILGTVKGDLHDIGKNLVGMMCEGAGFEVHDLGRNVDPEVFIDAIDEHQPQLLGMSALLTTTMISMDKTIQALISAGKRDKVKVMVGGSPVNQDFADRIGADGYAPNAAAAADLSKKLVAEI
jgi:5-methyltetrahydrofolate--homocysteine methyltransferase